MTVDELIFDWRLRNERQITVDKLQAEIDDVSFHIPPSPPAHLHVLKKNQFKLDGDVSEFKKLPIKVYDGSILDEFRW